MLSLWALSGSEVQSSLSLVPSVLNKKATFTDSHRSIKAISADVKHVLVEVGKKEAGICGEGIKVRKRIMLSFDS